MRYQHSFWYSDRREIYQEALNADPECAIAYWGIALSLLNNPHGAIPAPNLPLGLAAIEKAKAIGAKSERERDYIDALAAMYVDYENTPHPARVQSYLKAMEALAAKYPDDDEAQIFYAITLMSRRLGRQDLRQPAQGRRDPRADLRSASRNIPASRTI